MAGPSEAPVSFMLLDELENQSIYILREAFNKFERLAMLWSIGKDSTVLLWLARKAFSAMCPSRWCISIRASRSRA